MSDTRRALLALRFALAPVLVWLLSQLIFEAIVFDTDAAIRHLEQALAGSELREQRPMAEAHARVLWGSGLLLFLVVSASVAGYSVWLLRRLDAGLRRPFVAVAAVAALASLAHAAWSGATHNAFSTIYHLSYEPLTACGCYTAGELAVVNVAITVLNVLAATVPPLALVAGCSVLILPRDDDAAALAELSRRFRSLKSVLNAGSALLVAGVLHQVVWHRWPATQLAGDAATDLLRYAESLSLYWGGTYTLLAIAFYGLPAWLITQRARHIIESTPGVIGEEPCEQWLERNGLSAAPLRQLPQLTAMFAPLLAGPLGTGVSGLLSPIAG